MPKFLIAAIAAIGLVFFIAHEASGQHLSSCSSCFVGELQLSENPGDPTGKTEILGSDFYFIDRTKIVWKAGKGDITDGASIPELFQPIIGGPWELDYLPAAVMHDHYTNKEHIVRPWRTTDRMFFQAMLVRHVDVIKAKLMYYAVYIFGPHWDHLKKGIPCGPNCVFLKSNKTTYQSADYALVHQQELTEVHQLISDAELRGYTLKPTRS